MRVRITKVAAIATATVLLAAGTAHAHATVTGTNTVIDSYGTMTFGIGHGCEGKPTERVNIKIPDGVMSVTPARHAFWDVEVKKRKLDDPVDGPHGEQITEVPDELIYTTASEALPDDRLDQLVISARWGSEAGALWFPTVQTCPDGAKASWIQIPKDGEDAHDLEHPAPGLVLTEAGDDGHGGEATDDAADDADHDSDEDAEQTSATEDSDDDDVQGARRLGMAGIGTGVLGILFGIAGMRRGRK